MPNRPAETATIVAGVVAILVIFGVDSQTASIIAAALVAIVPAVTTWIVNQRRGAGGA